VEDAMKEVLNSKTSSVQNEDKKEQGEQTELIEMTNLTKEMMGK